MQPAALPWIDPSWTRYDMGLRHDNSWVPAESRITELVEELADDAIGKLNGGPRHRGRPVIAVERAYCSVLRAARPEACARSGNVSMTRSPICVVCDEVSVLHLRRDTTRSTGLPPLSAAQRKSWPRASRNDSPRALTTPATMEMLLTRSSRGPRAQPAATQKRVCTMSLGVRSSTWRRLHLVKDGGTACIQVADVCHMQFPSKRKFSTSTNGTLAFSS